MKILFVIDQYGNGNNGVSVSAQRYVGLLRERGHEVRLLCTRGYGEGDYTVRELRVPIFDKLIKSQGMVFGRPDRETLDRAIAWADIVHFMMPFALSIRGAARAKKLGKPATAAFHVQPQNISYSIGMGRCGAVNRLIYWWFRTAFFDRFRHVHCPSAFIAGELARAKYRAQLHVISNGIDPDFRYQKEQKPPAWEDKFVILMIGRFSREKRQDVLLSAAAKSRYADRIQIVLAGQGPRRDQLAAQGAALQNPAILHFFSKEELLALIARCDLYVHAADAEIEAMSCMEAFAGGLVPVIADSEKSATPQFALDERSLFRAGDSGDLARRIDWWIEHPAERTEMERRYSAAAEQYGLAACVARFEEMLRAAAEEGAWR